MSEQNDTYIPCDENYTLEIWHDRLGLIKRIAGNTHDISLDCGSMPMGVYQMILIVNDCVAAKSKLLKL